MKLFFITLFYQVFCFLNMASISWVADSPLWRMFSRFVFALVGPESSSSNTVASTADHSDQPGKNPLKYSAVAGN